MKNLYSFVFALFVSLNIWAQTPQKMSYQAVIRNSSNALITSSPIGMQISILQGSATGSVIYAETQITNTNANGLVSIEIGNGTVLTGTFSAINWANGPYFIKTETDPTGGSAYTISGTSELLSVPYALHAKTAESISGGITETDPIFGASVASTITTTDINNWNNKLSSETDPVFAASVANVITSTDVANWNNKLSTEVDGSISNELQTLRISNDTIYLTNGGYAKLPAGFNGDYNSLTNKPTAVSSFSNDAGYLTSFTEVDGSVSNELQTLRISNDTIYLTNGGYIKLPAGNEWSLNGNSGTVDGTNFIGTTDNVPLNFKVNNQKVGRVDSNSDVFLGYQAGSNSTAIENTAIGYQALQQTNNPLSLANTAIGYKALKSNNGLGRNTAVGTHAMLNNTTGEWNTGVGASSMQNNTTGSSNIAFGGTSLSSNQTGSGNTSLGGNSLMNNVAGNNGVAVGFGSQQNANNTSTSYDNTNTSLGYQSLMGSGSPATNTGLNNTAIGRESLKSNSSGSNNVAIGEQALSANTTGYANTGLGRYALKGITTGYNNTAVGQSAMYINTTGSNNSVFGTGSLLNQTSGDDNTSIGTSGFYNKTSGNANTSIGMEAGFNNASGSGNVFLGYRAGYSETGSNKLYIANSNTTTPLIYGDFSSGRVGIGTTSPSFKLEVSDDALFNGVRVGTGSGANVQNAVLGYQALQSNTSGHFNTAIGYQVMYPNTTGDYNTAVGTAALGGNTTGGQNCAYGYASLVTRTTSTDNSAYGVNSLRFGSTGDKNSAFGSSALLNNGGNNNTAIGFQTGQNNYNGSGNVFLGYQAGYNESGSDKLYIANSSTTTPLIYGDFSNGNVGIGTTTIGERLVVQGNHTDGRIATFQNVFDEKYITMGQIITDDGGYIKYKKSSNYIGIGIHGHTEQLIVNGSGNVGIGTTSPSYKLDVNGDALLNGVRFGRGNGTGQYNVVAGLDNLSVNTSGSYNTALGTFSLMRNTTGSSNTANGYAALYYMLSGSNNTGIGNGALYANSIGNYNTALGEGAGRENLGSSNVFIGYNAGYYELGSNKLYIANSSTTTPLIYGDFSIGNVGIGTTTPTAKLEVNGSIKISGGTSSQFLKADGSLDNNTYLTTILEVADEYSATALQTSFTLTQIPSANSKVKMYINGIRISNTAYSITGTTLTYVPVNNGSYLLSAGDRIQFDYSY